MGSIYCQSMINPESDGWWSACASASCHNILWHLMHRSGGVHITPHYLSQSDSVKQVLKKTKNADVFVLYSAFIIRRISAPQGFTQPHILSVYCKWKSKIQHIQGSATMEENCIFKT